MTETLETPADDQNKEEQQQPFHRTPKIGLALGAGVARGWAHIGVIRELAKSGVQPDAIAGTSIGAVVGGAMAAGALDEVEDWARSLKEFNFFRFLDWKLGRNGLFGSARLNDLMRDRFGSWQIENLDTPFTAVACELKTGHEIWLKDGPMSDAIQASFALPGVFEPVRLKGRWLVDGALVNPTPVSVLRAQGCDLVIAVNLAEDLYGRARARQAAHEASDEFGVFSDIASSPSAGGRRNNKAFLRRLFSKNADAPSMLSNMIASLSILQNRLSRSRLAGDPPDVSINPRTGHVGLMEFHRAEELIEEGAAAFEIAKPQVLDAVEIITHRINS